VAPPTSISLLRVRRSPSNEQLVMTPASTIRKKPRSALSANVTSTAWNVAMPTANRWSYAIARIMATRIVGAIPKK